MLIICLHTTFDITLSSGPVVIIVKLKAKWKFCTAIMLFYMWW